MALFKSKKTKETKPAAAPVEVKETKAAPVAVSGHRPNYAVLKKPWISEKALVAGAHEQYAFAVDVTATKPMVRDEVERRYGVHVLGVNVIRFTGKQKHYRGKLSHKMVQKKAIVTLKKGEKIDIQ